MAKQRRKRGIAGDKTICFPLADDLDYATLVEDREAFRQYLDKQIAAHRELFPAGIEAGYRFHGWVESSRQRQTLACLSGHQQATLCPTIATIAGVGEHTYLAQGH